MKTMRNMTVIMAILMIAGMSTIFAACNVIPGGIRGDGNVLKETRKVSSFNGIEVSGAFDIFLKQGDVEEVIVESDANLLPVIRTEVVGNTLKIETTKPVNNVTTMKVYVTLKDLKSLDISGAVDVESTGRLNLNELEIDASGASDSKLDIFVQKLDLDCSGASKLKFSGSAKEVNMDLSGASDIFAFDLLSESYSLGISGAGNAQINVSKSLKADISGAGNVKYRGNPSTVDQHISGAGSIKKVE